MPAEAPMRKTLDTATTVTRMMTYAYRQRNINERVSKREAYQTLRQMVEKLPPEEISMDMSVQLTALFNYFQPNKPKKPKTIWDWLGQIVNANEVRKQLHYVYVDDMTMQTTDGYRLYAVLNDGDLEPGWYMPTTKDKLSDQEIDTMNLKWPNTQTYLEGTDATIDFGTITLDDFLDLGTMQDKPRIDGLELNHRDEDGQTYSFHFNRQFVEEALRLPVDELPTATLSHVDHGYLRLLWEEHGVLAVIRGCRKPDTH